MIFINNTQIESFNFPGGECHIKLGDSVIDPDSYNDIEITAFLKSSDDIMKLLLSIDAIRHINFHAPIVLTIPYFPYARQDRVCNPGEPLSVKVMANLINSLKCKKVIIFDPHSDVSAALINDCTIVDLKHIFQCSRLIQESIKKNSLFLCSADAGGEKKVIKLSRFIWDNVAHLMTPIRAYKVRNTSTGEIVSTQVQDYVKGKNILIVDDICDGGATFIALAKALKEKRAGDLYLYVTHGIFSKGLESLFEHFKEIYCYHTFLAPGRDLYYDDLKIIGDFK